jgi:crotonobetainyl-CoA:carnitine CoA-transferase CaiB-like acyl-CoA transferase
MEILEKVKVLDLSQIMAGPLSSMILGDLGAEVIKVEPPEGDAARVMGDTFLHGQSDYLLSLNRNKRSMVIDLKMESGREIFYRLARQADVLLENFRPGTVEKLGVDYPTVSRLNPRIIYCSVSGFGQEGPYRDRPAMDPIIQAMGGLMGITGDPRTGPAKVGSPISDFIAPLLATIGILGGLYLRQKTGEGQKVEISMLDGIIFSLIPRQAYFFVKNKSLPLTGNRHYQISPCNAYPTKDGQHVMVIVHTQKHWANFCEALGRMDLPVDSRFRTNADRLKNCAELDGLLTGIFQQKTQREWVDSLAGKGVMIGPVYRMDQLFQDPQVVHNEMVAEIDHPLAGKIKALRTPIRFSASPLSIKRPPPLLGQHTEEILSELGYTAEEIERRKATGAVKGAKGLKEGPLEG